MGGSSTEKNREVPPTTTAKKRKKNGEKKEKEEEDARAQSDSSDGRRVPVDVVDVVDVADVADAVVDGRECAVGSVVLAVVHVAYVPVEAVLALDLVGTHGTGELRLDAALVALVLDEGAAARVAPAAARAHVRLVLDQRRHRRRARRPPPVPCARSKTLGRLAFFCFFCLFDCFWN